MLKKEEYLQEEKFTHEGLVELLNKIVGKTLGEVDKKHVFDKTKSNPKITGIAGDVVEQSVLGYNANSKKRPDILVDGKTVEVKTTGICFEDKNNKNSQFVAKEPMSITAVSVNNIVDEEFYDSHFWNKISNLLLIYYLYDSNIRVMAKDYANFVLKGSDFFKFGEEDEKILKNDWELVRNFIRNIQQEFPINPEQQYYRLSSELRDKLMYIDTAPKWPNPPRFRLKRTVVTTIVQKYFNKLKYINLPETIESFKEFDMKLHEITNKYKGKNVKQLIDIFGIKINNPKKLNKAIAEKIIVNMFGGSTSKLNKIALFSNAGINAKTISLTSKGQRTEDTKLFPIDFSELEDQDINFEDSFVYDYFMNHQTLFIIFEEKDEKQEFIDNIFIGFKRFIYDIDFINSEVKKTWEDLRKLVIEKKINENRIIMKNGKYKVNTKGTYATEINFPKSKNHIVFVRGGGKDSNTKSFYYQGIWMYRQYMWIKGKYLVEKLKDKEII